MTISPIIDAAFIGITKILRIMTAAKRDTTENTLHVAFGVDDNYFRGMGVMITSMLKHNPDMAFIFHIFAFSVSVDNQKRIDLLAQQHHTDIRIHILSPESLTRFAHLPYYGTYPLGTIIRLLIPNQLAAITDKVLYVDADILCFGNLQEIMTIDIDHVVAAVVADEAATTAATQIAALNLPVPEYFNAGVMYINTQKWVDIDAEISTLTTLFTQQLRFVDQDVLNLVLNGKTLYINEKWNYRYHLVDFLSHGESTLTLPENLIFMHFTGPVKPWQDWCIHEAKDIFLKLQADSSWKDIPLDKPMRVNELKLYSKFLLKQGRTIKGIIWHLKYLLQKTLEHK
jgi:lipopolysaccharide biosynthesis glycosyltransferase